MPTDPRTFRTYSPGSHIGTVDGSAQHGYTILCDCGQLFPAVKHPVEDQVDSEQWTDHVRAERMKANA